jgi:hypothetical protein
MTFVATKRFDVSMLITKLQLGIRSRLVNADAMGAGVLRLVYIWQVCIYGKVVSSMPCDLSQRNLAHTEQPGSADSDLRPVQGLLQLKST